MVFEGLPNAPSTAHGARSAAATELRRSRCCDGACSCQGPWLNVQPPFNHPGQTPLFGRCSTTHGWLNTVLFSNTQLRPDGGVRAVCDDGEVLVCDALVVAVPLGVLQQSPEDGGIRFTPELPKVQREAIGRLMGFGVLIKVALVFKEAFW